MSIQSTTSTNARSTPPPPSARKRKRLAPWTVLAVAVAAAVLMLAPFWLMVLNAFKTAGDYSTNGPLAWPQNFTLQAFTGYLSMVNFPVALWNSIFISTLVAFLGVGVALLSAYAIGIGKVKGSGPIVAVLLLATILPQEALIYPLFYGAQATGTFNSVWSVTVIFTVIQAAFGTYILSSVMSTIPRELLDAAAIDGSNRWQILWHIVLPVLRPTLSVLVVFFFIWTWNEFLIPLVLLSDPSSQTIPIALSTLRGQYSIDITVINAGSLLSLIPTLIFFLIFQRTLSRGVTAGSVK